MYVLACVCVGGVMVVRCLVQPVLDGCTYLGALLRLACDCKSGFSASSHESPAPGCQAVGKGRAGGHSTSRWAGAAGLGGILITGQWRGPAWAPHGPGHWRPSHLLAAY